jgi:hypothetical protein
VKKFNWVFAILPVRYFHVKNQDFIQSDNYLVNISEHYSALNFMVFATELKLLIFKISARTFLKNFSFRKELKLFATSCK